MRPLSMSYSFDSSGKVEHTILLLFLVVFHSRIFIGSAPTSTQYKHTHLVVFSPPCVMGTCVYDMLLPLAGCHDPLPLYAPQKDDVSSVQLYIKIYEIANLKDF